MKYIITFLIFISTTCFAKTDIKSLLENELKVEVRPYSTTDFGRDRNFNAISFITPEKGSKLALIVVRDLIPDDYLAFIGTTRNFSKDTIDGVEIVIIKSKDKLDILRTSKSDGINYGITNKLVVSKIREWDKLYDVDIWQAESDTIQMKFETLPKDLNAFSKEVYKFCPDIVDQGSGDINDISNYLKDTKQVYLWWD